METLQALWTWETLLCVGAMLVSGLVRGFNGGAGANFFSAPVLSAVVGPREAVPVILIVNFLSGIQLVTQAVPYARAAPREALALGLGGALCVPLGAWLLFTVDETVMRRAVAAVALVFSLVLLAGWRYRGRHGPGLAAVAGAVGGVITGAVSLGGPPVILYLMSGMADAARSRAAFIVYGVGVTLSATIAYLVGGALTARVLWLIAILMPAYALTTWVGTRLFLRAGGAAYRRLTLWLMVAVSLAVLVA